MKLHFQQALFGYDSGHNLLAASCNLLPENRRFLAALTDSPGAWPSTGFKRVFTGTILPASPYYALFATWPAPEQVRPGCVWSHVILIALPDLASIADLGDLRPLFNKPSGEMGGKWNEPIEYYSEVLALEVSRISALTDDQQTLIWNLYEKPKESAIATASSSDTYEDLVFAIWSQQWPRLRRAFRFSTGSFADRNRENIIFDLQITPLSYFKSKKDIGNTSFQDISISKEEWFAMAISDLEKPDFVFRKFLQNNGAEIESPRDEFSNLTTIYCDLQNTSASEWNIVLQKISALFPSPTSAVKLKKSSLEGPDNIDNDVEFNWRIAEFLFSESSKSYQNAWTSLDTTAEILWEKDRSNLLNFLSLGNSWNGDNGKEHLMQSLSRCLDQKAFKDLAKTHPRLFTGFIHIDPNLALETNIWRLPREIQGDILDILDESSLPENFWAKLAAVMLQAETDIEVPLVIERGAEHVIPAILDKLKEDRTKQGLPTNLWRTALVYRATEYLDKHYLAAPELALLISLLPPAKAASISPHREEVQMLANVDLVELPKSVQTYTAFFLTALALKSPCEVGTELLCRGFFSTYRALASMSYPWEAWQILQPQLPRPFFFPEWDKCRGLCNGVNEWLENCPNARKRLFLAAGKEDQGILERIR